VTVTVTVTVSYRSAVRFPDRLRAVANFLAMASHSLCPLRLRGASILRADGVSHQSHLNSLCVAHTLV
jgi:hypothetical protein